MAGSPYQLAQDAGGGSDTNSTAAHGGATDVPSGLSCADTCRGCCLAISGYRLSTPPPAYSSRHAGRQANA